MITPRISDALTRAADLLDLARSPEAETAREVIARAAEHARTCEACARFDPTRLLAECAAAMNVVIDDGIDAAAIELAHELERAACRADVEVLR